MKTLIASFASILVLVSIAWAASGTKTPVASGPKTANTYATYSSVTCKTPGETKWNKSYLFVCISSNTMGAKNGKWRRVSLGQGW